MSIANGLLVIMSFFGTVLPLSTDSAEVRTLHPAGRCRRVVRYPFSPQVRSAYSGGGAGSSVTEPLLVRRGEPHRVGGYLLVSLFLLMRQRNPPLNASSRRSQGFRNIRGFPEAAAEAVSTHAAPTNTVPLPTPPRRWYLHLRHSAR